MRYCPVIRSVVSLQLRNKKGILAMIYIVFLSGLISFVSLHAMLPYTRQLEKSKEQTIKIICLADEKTVIPVNIAAMSNVLTNTINYNQEDAITKKGNIISIDSDKINNLSPISISAYSCSILNALCRILEDFSSTKILNPQKIHYGLERLITISNAFHYLDFSENKDLATQWNKKIDSRIYQQCKDMSWNDLEKQIIPLYPATLHQDLVDVIFCSPIINKIKFELIKKAFTHRKPKLPTGDTGGIVFSP